MRRLLGGRETEVNHALKRLHLETMPDLVYAIGDVHGHVGMLQALEAKIVADAQGQTGAKLIVMLGDLIDRGPRSAQVLDHVTRPLAQGWQRICLAGNHEMTMLQAREDLRVLSRWLDFGGLETLGSYGIGFDRIRAALADRHKARELLDAYVPGEHWAFLEALPVSLEIANCIFAHAGLRPRRTLAEHSDDDLLWYAGEREDDARDDGRLVIHGHIAVKQAEVHSGRINIDTGAYVSGRLTAVRLAHKEAPRLITHDASPDQGGVDIRPAHRLPM